MVSNNFLRRALGKILSRSDQQQPSLHQRRLFLENLEDRRLLAADICSIPFFSPVAPTDDSHDHFDDHYAMPVFVDGILTLGDVETQFPYGKENTFLLASNPTATKTIYLDYDGHHSVNNDWNEDVVFPAFNFEGSPDNFSDNEHSRIQAQFIEVVEDFLPFDVNVTTIDPGLAALTNSGSGDVTWGVRSVNTQCLSQSCPGGTAGFIGKFAEDADNHVLVYNKTLGSGGQTNTHEIGHRLGLLHDGLPGQTYHPGVGNNSTDTSWGPIMGAPFGKNLVQWNNGDYPGATNTTQDDLAIITNNTNGIEYRSDDHGNTRSTATALVITSDTEVNVNEVDNLGIIERTDDVDYFSFTTGSGNVALQINPLAVRGSLDVEATLYDSQGNQIAISNPPNEIHASFNQNLAAGEYFIGVDGVGNNNSSNSDYGSLGYYEITGTIIKATNEPPTVNTIANVTLNEDDLPLGVNLSGISSGAGESQPIRVTASSSNTVLMADPAVQYITPNPTGMLTVAPLADQFGTTTITVTVEDGGLDNNLTTTADNLTVSRTFDVTVNPVNDVPTLDALSNLTTDEDAPTQTVNLSGITAGGAETQPLKITATSSNTNLIADPVITYTSDHSNGSLGFDQKTNQFGTTTITVTVEDGGLDGNLATATDNAVFSRTFNVTVNPVNDVPTLDALSDITTDEDAPQTIDLTGITAGPNETQTLIVTATSADTNLIPHPSVAYTNGTTVGTINYTPVANQSGSTTVTVTVEDGGLDDNLATSGDNLTVSRTFTVVVNPLDDDPPTVDPIADVNVDEDANTTSVGFDGITAGLNETQEIRISATSSNASLVGDPTIDYTSGNADGILEFKPLADQFGTSTITVTVEDGGLDSDFSTLADNLTTTTTFDITVSPVNDVPLGDTIPDMTVDEEASTSVNLTGLNAGPNENESLRLSAVSSDPALIGNPTIGYTIGDSTGSLNFTPLADQIGTATITLTIEDGGLDNNLATPGDNLTTTRSFDVTVSPINDLPTGNPIADVSVNEDAPIQTVNFTGISAGPNETQPLFITATSGDTDLLDDPTVNYTSNDPTGTINFTPLADQYGTTTITVTIEDGGLDGDLTTPADNATSSNTFDITISPVNDVPSGNPIPDVTVDEDQPTQTVNFAGISAGPNESQNMRITATSSDTDLIADPEVTYTNGDTAGSLNYTPKTDRFGTSTIIVTVEDGGLDNDLNTSGDNLTSTLSFDVTVDPVNDAPAQTPVANVTINEDTPATISVTGINSGPNESQPIRMVATSSDSSIVPDPTVNYSSGNTSGALNFTPRADQYGTSTITVTVEDGGLDNDLATPGDNLTTSSSFDVTVSPVNDLPTGDPIADVSVDEDASIQTVNLTGISAGPNESQPVRISAVSGDPGLVGNPIVQYNNGSAFGAVNFTPVADQYGTTTITVTVEDGGQDQNLATAGDNLTTQQLFDVTVLPVNDIPTRDPVADVTVDEDAPTQTISLTGITAGINESQPLRITATSSNSDRLADPVVNYTSGSDTGSLQLTPIAFQDGKVTITVHVEDGGLDNDLTTAADNLTISDSFQVTVLPTLGDYREPDHQAVMLEQVTRLESGVKSFSFTTDTTGYYQIVTATEFDSDVTLATPTILNDQGQVVSTTASGNVWERESMSFSTVLLEPGNYQLEVGSFNGADKRMKLTVAMPAVTTSSTLNEKAVDLTTGAVLQNELGVNGLSSGLFQQIYDVDLSSPIFHQEFDANLDNSLTSFDLKTVRFNNEKSAPSVSLSMNATASHAPAFALAVTADGEMGVADTFGMSIYQNPVSMNDVNGDSQVTPNDALVIINHLNSGATQRLDALQLVNSLNVSGFIDTNGDYNSSPIDVLQVINELNAMTTDVVVDQGAEGEGFVATANRASMLLQRTDTADLHFESLDVVDPVDIDFGFNLNEQRCSITAESNTWPTEVDKLFDVGELEDLLEVLHN